MADRPILSTLRDEHPRLLVTSSDFARLRELVRTDLQAQIWYASLKSRANRLLYQPVSQYEKHDGRNITPVSVQVLDRVRLLASVYHIENDERFAERAWQELEAVAQFPDWNPVHFLDTAEMTHGFAIGYDWLYHVWTEEQKELLREAMIRLGLEPGLNAYRGLPGYGGWVRGTNNWNLVCNGGLAMGALAIADEEPELAEQILRYGLQSVPAAIGKFGPDGGWEEGVSYWNYSIRYLVPYLAGLESALGTCFGLDRIPGLEYAGLFPIYLTSPAKVSFNFADGGPGVVDQPGLYWLSRRFNDPAYAWWQDEVSGGRPSVLALIWYGKELREGFDLRDLPLDRHFRGVEVATMRSAWDDEEGLFVGWKAGDLRASHGHLDLGTFVFDALGVRWALDLGSDNYNMPGYFGSRGWTYYRKRAEGHNTLVLNPSTDPDQDPTAVARIIFQGGGEGEAISIADLTPGYRRHANSVKRGIALFDDRSKLLVQDEIEADRPAEVWWFMHTTADIQLGDNASEAIISQDGQRLAVRILSPPGATFTVMPAMPLPTSPNPEMQDDNLGIQKLAIRLNDVTVTRITVQMTPLVGDAVASLAPAVKPLDVWKQTAEAGERVWSPLERIAVDWGSLRELDGAVRGVLPLDIKLGLPDSVTLESLSITVDDEPLFSATTPPEDLVLDTRTLPDGTHFIRLQAVINGTSVTDALTFDVENHWTLIDRMEPPVDGGWFGMLIRSRTSAESDGWTYIIAPMDAPLGGVDRRIRKQDTEEYMIWETPRLRSVRVAVEAFKADVNSALRMSVSSDLEVWHELPYTAVLEPGRSEDEFQGLILTAEVPDTEEVNWCKLQILPGYFAPDALRIAWAEFIGWHE